MEDQKSCSYKLKNSVNEHQDGPTYCVTFNNTDLRHHRLFASCTGRRVEFLAPHRRIFPWNLIIYSLAILALYANFLHGVYLIGGPDAHTSTIVEWDHVKALSDIGSITVFIRAPNEIHQSMLHLELYSSLILLQITIYDCLPDGNLDPVQGYMDNSVSQTTPQRLYTPTPRSAIYCACLAAN